MKRFLAIAAILLWASSAHAQGLTAGGGSGGSGGGGGSSTPFAVNGSPVPATASPQSYLVTGPGGSPSWAPTPSVNPAVNELGTISNAGTATCNFSGTNICHFTVASGASITIGNPTNLPTNNIVQIGFSQAASGVPTLTWGTHFFAYDNSGVQSMVTMNSDSFWNFAIFTNSTNGTAWANFWSDGTNLTLVPGSSLQIAANQIFSQNNITSQAGNISAAGGNISASGLITGGTSSGGVQNECSGVITLAAGIGNSVVAANTNTGTGANLAGSCIKNFTNIGCMVISNSNVGKAPATPANTPAVVNCFASATATATAGMAATATQTAIYAVASTSNSTATILWWGQY